MRTDVKHTLRVLSSYIYKTIFDKDSIYPHVLLRDYARGVIEYAIFKGMTDGIDPKLVRPPYKSKWYEYIPEMDEINKYNFDYQSEDLKKHYYAQNTIISSMTTEYGRGISGYGDFGRYVFQSAVSNWEHQFNDSQVLSNIATKKVFELGYDIDLHGKYDSYHVGRYDRHDHAIERIGKKYQWIAFHELLAKLSDKFPMSEIDWSYDKSTIDEIDFDKWLKTIELGDYEEIDSVDSLEKEEVAQEKYEDDESGAQKRKYKEIPYHGPWNPFVRDIDPTLLFITQKNKDSNYYQAKYTIPEDNLNDWVHDFETIPELKEIMFVDIRENQNFMLLSSHIKWERRKNNDDYKNREELFIKTTALLVPMERVKYYSQHKKVHDHSYRNHWESSYKIFAYEYFWHPSYLDYKNEVDPWDEEIIPTTLEYSWEKGYDNSIDGSVGYLMPSELLVEQLGLAQGNEGYWTDQDGQVIAYDIAVEGYNTGLIIEQKSLERLMERNNLAIIWDVYISKIGENQLHEWRLVTSLNDGQIEIEYKYDEATWKLHD
ncbi:hypothetical protein [Paenibacillus silvisoli]|uniref:hypothetical protein n=1 Tax=Paenibacillus silvisoli TaxID=3110539 RepID=UPI0028041EB6|nr:hypothetical protein [Paenibacillus silvisoli]